MAKPIGNRSHVAIHQLASYSYKDVDHLLTYRVVRAFDIV